MFQRSCTVCNDYGDVKNAVHARPTSLRYGRRLVVSDIGRVLFFQKPSCYPNHREGRGDSSSSSSSSSWCRKVGDVLLCTFDVVTMDHYIKYLDAHAAILERMELAVMQDAR